MTFITIGELVVDWLSSPGQSLLESGSFVRCLGGNASNVAVGLKRLGSSVRLLGKVGHDADGNYLLHILTREGVDVSHVIKDRDHHTSQCYCLTRTDGEHEFYNWPRNSAGQMLRTDEIAKSDLDGAHFLHATGISLTREPRSSAVQKAIDIAVERGMIFSFDASFPTGEDASARLVFERFMSRAHILKMNYPELQFWAQASAPSPVSQLARQVFSKFKPIVLAATLGAEGAVLLTESEEIKCHPFRVKSLDGIGAGDGFIAGLLHALGKCLGSFASPSKLSDVGKQDWQTAGDLASAAGALVTRCIGAYEGLPVTAEVETLMRERLGDGRCGKPQ